jgi:hypothetical protein
MTPIDIKKESYDSLCIAVANFRGLGMSFEVIAKMLKLSTKERARQLCAKGERLLKHGHHSPT